MRLDGFAELEVVVEVEVVPPQPPEVVAERSECEAHQLPALVRLQILMAPEFARGSLIARPLAQHFR